MDLAMTIDQASVAERLHKSLDISGLGAVQNSPLMLGQ